MTDAAEIARLLAIAQKELPFERASELADKANGWGYRVAFKPSVATALLDALEQAQKDAKDARALLAEAKPYVPNLSFSMSRELAARIEAMLEQKP